MITKIEKFGAAWCNPCRILDKTLKDVLKNYPDIELVKYDADKDEDAFEEKHIISVPQIFFYNNEGLEVNHFIGIVSADKIIEIIDQYNTKAQNNAGK